MKKLFFIIISAIFITASVFLFFIFSFFSPQSQPPPQLFTPTAVPTLVEGQYLNTVRYDSKKTETLIEKAKERSELSSAGKEAKEKLINSLDNQSGAIYSSPVVRIDYIKSPDLFQAEIITPNIPAGKQESSDWMIKQGFTASDLCSLPFSFYLGSKARESVLSTGTIFNPLPEGC